MIKIKTDEEKLLNFDLQIEGTQSQPKVNFVIEGLSPGYNLTVPCDISGSGVSVKIPKLGGFLSESMNGKTVRGRIEAILDDNFYESWSGEIELETPVRIEAKEPKMVEEEKPKITARLTDVKKKPIEEKKTPKPRKKKSFDELLKS